MTMAKRIDVDPVIPSDFERHVIELPDGPVEFTGKLLGDIDNERRGRPRWAEIRLYKYVVLDPARRSYGSQEYLLHTMGHSVVYHRHDSPCNRGVEVPVEEFAERAEFPQDLEPCADVVLRGRVASRGCYPPDWRTAAEGTPFGLEVLRHTKFALATADDVLQQLRRPAKVPCRTCGAAGWTGGIMCEACQGRGTVAGKPVLTAPGQRLVEIVRFRDPEMARALQRGVQL